MTFRAVLENDAEAAAYSSVCPELPGCASAGETEEAARANIRKAIELYLADTTTNPFQFRRQVHGTTFMMKLDSESPEVLHEH